MSIKKEAQTLLIKELNRRNVRDNELRAGLAAILEGESNWIPQYETSYKNTSNDRIRQIFASRLGTASDQFIYNLKSDDREFFNYIYNPKFNYIHHLGNEKEDDGYNRRGRGLIQITGLANDIRYGRMLGIDLEHHPELANELDNAIKISVAYILDRYKGGGWDKIKSAVGVSIGNVNDKKNRLFKEYRESGKFDWIEEDYFVSDSETDDAIENHVAANFKLQELLAKNGFYTARVDGDWGAISQGALARYRKKKASKVNEIYFKPGDSGNHIEELQKSLNNMNLTTIPVTGYFDGNTEKLVKVVQAGNSIPITGIVDKETLEVIEDGV